MTTPAVLPTDVLQDRLETMIDLFLAFVPATPEKLPPPRVVKAGPHHVQLVDPATIGKDGKGGRGMGAKIPIEEYERGKFDTSEQGDLARARDRAQAIQAEIRAAIKVTKLDPSKDEGIDPDSWEGAFLARFVARKLDPRSYETEVQIAAAKNEDNGGANYIARLVEWGVAGLTVFQPILDGFTAPKGEK